MNINRLDVDIRSDVRQYAFYVGNGTLIIGDTDIDYRPKLVENPEILKTLFVLYLKYEAEGDSDRDEEWLRSICDSEFDLDPPLSTEDANVELLDDWKLAIIEFTTLLCDSSSHIDAVSDSEVLSTILDYGSQLELVFAVLTNNFELDENLKVKNRLVSFQRAFEVVKGYVVADYEVNPPFDGWEVELV